MIPDADVQTWLEHQLEMGRAMIVPYVQSAADTRLHYDIDLTQRGPSGNSHISQHGQVELKAGHPASLSRVAVNAPSGGTCEMKIVLREEGKEIGVFRFDCAKQD